MPLTSLKFRNRSANPVPSQVARFELKRASGWV